jgi:hypothetical protein
MIIGFETRTVKRIPLRLRQFLQPWIYFLSDYPAKWVFVLSPN